jgi:L,D-transpeptidase catalytic domain
MRALFFSLTGLSSISLALVSVSCGFFSPTPVLHRRPDRKLYQWSDDGGTGKVAVRISLSDQIAEFKRGGRDIGWCYVASGKEGHDTRPGNYNIMEKIEDKHSNIYGWIEDAAGNVTDGDAKAGDRVPKGMIYVAAPMPCWMRLTSYGVGMHGGLIPQPGEPASHGCIRIPKDFVPVLFDAVEVGTPVSITDAPSNLNNPEPEAVTKIETRVEAKPKPAVITAKLKPQPQSQPQPVQISPRRRSDPQSAHSVTYHNGVPVFSE